MQQGRHNILRTYILIQLQLLYRSDRLVKKQ